MSGPYGEIVTFYSYKGGTGRSMVLANVGHLMATDQAYGNRRVLLIDWDLEAPGLERFFGAAHATNSAGPGLIDYLEDMAGYYRAIAHDGGMPESMARDPHVAGTFKTAAKQFPLRRYIAPVAGRPDLWLMHAGSRPPSVPASPAGGSVSQADGSAGQDHYWEKVRRFDWGHFYRNYGSFFTHFREMLMAEFDFVLIDSRTGLTDIGGICTRVMPQKLVLVFAPNHQNIDGVVGVATKSIGYRMASRDPRGLTVFPVASRIDASASVPRTVWRQGGEIRGELIDGYQDIFEALLRKAYQLDRCDLGDYFDATQIPHDSDYAYGEAIAAAVDGIGDRFGIGYACDQLARRLVQLTAPWEEDDEQPGEDPRTVFISYRRTDAHAARRLYGDLSERLGRDRVFFEVGPDGVGQPWSTAIEAQLETAGAVIVLIGTQWLQARGPSDSSYFDSSTVGDAPDFVRAEIVAALGRDLPVIPTLLDDAQMPTPGELPPDLQPLAARQPISLQASSWDSDVERLASALMTITSLRPPNRPVRPQPPGEPRAAQPQPEAGRRPMWPRIAAWFKSIFS